MSSFWIKYRWLKALVDPKSLQIPGQREDEKVSQSGACSTNQPSIYPIYNSDNLFIKDLIDQKSSKRFIDIWLVVKGMLKLFSKGPTSPWVTTLVSSFRLAITGL